MPTSPFHPIIAQWFADRFGEPQRLLEYVADERHTAHVREFRRPVAKRGIDFGAHARLHIRAIGDQIERPAERGGRGFVSRQKQHGDLIEQLLFVEARAGDGIGRRDECGENIVVRRRLAARNPRQ